MPSITNDQLKGNFAENLVTEWLSRVCLVRPVTAGTDIGVDLYCESIVENNPYLHFWAQVKAISKNDLTIKNGIESASYSFKRDHLEYWARQPIPVYAFLVPVIGWPPIYPERIYGLPITRYVIKNGLPETKKIKLETSDSTEFASINEDWNQFITQIVPIDSAILLFSKGLISNINFYKAEYQHFPRDIALKYAEEILDNVRDSAIILGSETLENKDDDYKRIRQICETIASLFTPRMHELGVNFLIESALKDGDIPRALRHIELIEEQVTQRKDIDDTKISEHISKLEMLKQRIRKS